MASQSSAAEGVDGAISEWVTGECNRISGQGLTPGGEEMHAGLVEASKLRELEAWQKLGVFSPHEACKEQKQIVQARWV